MSVPIVKILSEDKIPIVKVGRRDEDGAPIFEVTAPLNPQVLLSLKAHGYVSVIDVLLTDGSVINRAFAKAS